MNRVGKPDAGNPHVRFDERGQQTGSHRACARLYSRKRRMICTDFFSLNRLVARLKRLSFVLHRVQVFLPFMSNFASLFGV